MRQILFKSILALALGTAPGLAHAQGEMLKKKPAEQSEGQGGGQSGAEKGGQPMEQNEENGERPTTEGQQKGQNPQSEENRNEEGGEQKQPMGEEQKRPREHKGEEHKQGEEQKRPSEKQGEEHKQGEEQKRPGENRGEEHKQGEEQGGGGTSERHAERGHVSEEQRTEIKRVFVEHHVEPAHVNFSVDVGARVPREIHLYRLPPRIVEIVPAYEGYMYFELADGRIAIVDPHTLEIVLIIA
jgi:hypothetical protein